MTTRQIFLGLLWTSLLCLGCDRGDDSADSDTGTDTDTTDPEGCGAFATGVYPNYFVEAGYAADAVDEKLEAAFEQLFFGDADDETVYYEDGENADGPLGYIMDVDNDDVRSEGMSYGMMIALQMDRQDIFDALWNWAKTHMWHGDEGHPFYEYFSWSLHTDGRPKDEAPAPDGEEYFAMSLYFASGRWGDGEGIYDYQKQADRLVSAMRNREEISGRYVTAYRGEVEGTGDALFNPDEKMIRFSPHTGYYETAQGDHTDPSYHLPAFYELWALWGPEADSEFWLEAAEVSRDFFQDAAHPETALTPDYAHFDGTPVTNAWDTKKGTFGPDACRTVMNWSMDWAWFCADERAQALSDTLQNFFLGQGSSYVALYELDGTPLTEDNYYSYSVVAMNATAALSATDRSASKQLIRDLWRIEVPNGQYRYYDGMLYLFSLLHLSGNYRIYAPEQ